MVPVVWSSSEKAPTARISFRANRALYEAARNRAEREGRTVSALAREAMEHYIQGDPSSAR